MNYSKSITALFIGAALCFAATDAGAQGRGRGRDTRGRGPGIVGRAAPRVYAPNRYYAPGRRLYGGPRILGYAPYRPYYYPYRPGITLGFYAGYGYPYGYSSYGYYPYGYRSYYGYGYGYGYGPYGYPLPPAGYYSMRPGVAYGGVRIQGAPRDAQVFADGYYVGIVDDFDGAFQHLNLEAGTHRIEIRMPNGEPVSLDVNVLPGQTITYHAGWAP